LPCADGNIIREGAGSTYITATPAAVGAGALASRAVVDLADEERSGGWKRGLNSEGVLGVEKRERDCEEDDIESSGRHCVMRLLLQFEQVVLDRVTGA
jgi:hypothetical protein